jgi:hypothetical protein
VSLTVVVKIDYHHLAMTISTTSTKKHPLKVWAFLNDLTLGEVAADLGVSQPLVSLWMAGRRRIGATMADRIGEMTDGAVTLEDWSWIWLEGEDREIRKEGAGRDGGRAGRMAA